MIQTVDRPKLAAALAREMIAAGRHPRLLVEVNSGEEPQKAGIVPGELEGFLRHCRDDLGLAIDGLMAIPPAEEDIALHTALLAKLAARYGLGTLSLGMSADYEAAIASVPPTSGWARRSSARDPRAPRAEAGVAAPGQRRRTR